MQWKVLWTKWGEGAKQVLLGRHIEPVQLWIECKLAREGTVQPVPSEHKGGQIARPAERDGNDARQSIPGQDDHFQRRPLAQVGQRAVQFISNAHDRPEESHVAHGRRQWSGEVVVGERECDEAWHASAKRWVNRPGKIVIFEEEQLKLRCIDGSRYSNANQQKVGGTMANASD